jgi:hypothetical protein
LYSFVAGFDAVREEQRSRELGKDTLRTIFELREGKRLHEGENRIMRTFLLVFFKHDDADHVINFERGMAFNLRRKNEKCYESGGQNVTRRRGK